jgi:hypothetical protein
MKTKGGQTGTQKRFEVMNPSKRAAMLGEERTEDPENALEEKLSKISEDTKKKIMEVKQFVKGEK